MESAQIFARWQRLKRQNCETKQATTSQSGKAAKCASKTECEGTLSAGEMESAQIFARWQRLKRRHCETKQATTSQSGKAAKCASKTECEGTLSAGEMESPVNIDSPADFLPGNLYSILNIDLQYVVPLCWNFLTDFGNFEIEHSMSKYIYNEIFVHVATTIKCVM
jgi:hypothetical protein